LDAALKAGREGMHEMLTMSVVGPDGKRVFDMLYVPERDEFGSVISILGVARDITSLQLAHHELQMKEALLRSLIDSIPDLIFFKDLESRYLGFNKAFAEYCARSEAQMVGKTDYDFAPRAVAEFYRQKDKEMLASGRSRNNDEWITYPNGRSVLLDTRKTPLRGANGEVLGIIGVSRDITERRHMEEALRRREQEFRTLAEHSPDMIVRYDRSCRHIYVNPAYARNTGVFIRKARGASLETVWRRLLPCQEFREKLEQVIATGRGDQILLEWMRPGGQITSHRMQMVAEHDEAGEVSGVLVIGHDITELKATERRLEKSRAQLRGMTRRREDAREEERKRIAREIHDELGQLLSVLRLNVTTLDYRFGEDNAELRLKAQKMVGTVDSAINVVRNLAAKLRPAALSAGIASALEWLVQEFGDNTELECLLHLPEGEVQLDEERATVVFRIAQESLTNIMRHASASRAIISLRCQDEFCELEVSDDGSGFDPAQIAGQNSFGIIGMRERALMLGGALHIDSSIGRGTVLKLRLPIDDGMAEAVDSA
jgi:PAS domain S-box-containing protein